MGGAERFAETFFIFPGMNWRLIGISKVKNDAIFTTNNQNAAHIAAGARRVKKLEPT